MDRIIRWILNHKRFVIAIYIVVIVVSILLSQLVDINFNMADYLPQEMPSRQAIDIIEKEYAYNGSANVMLKGLSPVEVMDYEKQIENLPEVDQVIWLDDIIDMNQPLSYADPELVEQYFKDNNALMQVIFKEYDYAESTTVALDKISDIISDTGYISGPAVNAENLKSSVQGNTKTGMIVLLPIILLILLLATDSYFETILFLGTIGISIVLNNGSNIIFGEISFMTSSASSLLQVAIAMDYAIFLLHRFSEERKKTDDIKEAMVRAVKHSFSSISASAFTTVIGFLALVFMSFKIGLDMGLVLAKGIVISLITVMTLLPVLVLGSIKLIDKTHHRSIIPSFKKLERVLEKGRYVTLTLLVVLALVAYLGQSSNEFLYGGGDNQLSKEATIAFKETEKVFGKHNKVILMVPRGDKISESKMVEELSNEPYIDTIQGMYSLVDPEIPNHMIPQAVKDQFLSENYSRYMLNLNTDIETPRSIAAIESANTLVSKYYSEFHMTGETPNVVDMRDVSKSDYFIVTFISIAAVGLILLITFRSISLPLILLTVIQVSIWINMSVSYFSGAQTLFLGYLIVTALQLGATIDYAILLTNRYVESRKTLDPHESAVEAITKAGQSILTSAGILGVAGLTISFVFSQATMKQMGLLVGRGAIISGLMVFIVLPQLLVIFDKLIGVTTLKWSGIKQQSSRKGSVKK